MVVWAHQFFFIVSMQSCNWVPHLCRANSESFRTFQAWSWYSCWSAMTQIHHLWTPFLFLFLDPFCFSLGSLWVFSSLHCGLFKKILSQYIRHLLCEASTHLWHCKLPLRSIVLAGEKSLPLVSMTYASWGWGDIPSWFLWSRRAAPF